VITPSPESHIEFEVWLPTSGWNGRYMGVGNGGSGGFINYASANGPSLAGALSDGFAASSTDTGHHGDNDDFSFARGHREQRIDYHYRAIHETASAAKAVIHTLYGATPKYSYFSGCSDGGRQGLVEAQRYPADYDGVLVCSPAVNRTHSIAAWAWVAQAVATEPSSEIPPKKLLMIHGAVIGSCDAIDGLEDGVVAEPMKCRFDPASLLCKGGESERCLTQPQVTTLTKFYSGPQNSKGVAIASGFLPGSETDPEGALSSCQGCKGSALHRASIFLEGMFDTRFNVKTFDFDRDLEALESTEDAKLTSTTNPNLRALKDRGGKLIIVHGWSDGADPAMLSVKYYDSVISAMGPKAVDQFFRLYMVPDVYHNASRGPGPTAFPKPMLTALEKWVENKKAPEAVIATRYRIDGDPTSGIARTRPLCPYPEVAVYKGTGSIDDAVNFSCKLH
jgi:feruloyl esterase